MMLASSHHGWPPALLWSDLGVSALHWCELGISALSWCELGVPALPWCELVAGTQVCSIVVGVSEPLASTWDASAQR